MDYSEMQTRCDTLADQITAKGRESAEVSVHIDSHGKPLVSTRYGKNWYNHDCQSAYHRSDTLEEAFGKAAEWINDITSLEKESYNKLLGKVADALDYASEHHIKADFVNPLEVLMKQLSSNALK